MDKPLIVCDGVSVTRESFRSHVARISGGLAALGVEEGERVALMMRNSVDFVELTVAIGARGAFAVPINWHFTLREVAMLLEDCAPRAIVVDEDLIASVPEDWFERAAVIRVPRNRDESADAPDDRSFFTWRRTAPADLGPPRPSPGSIAYTSGTTGQPKGVKRAAATPDQQRGMAKVRMFLYRLSPDDRVLVPGPLYHAFPNQLAVAATHLAASLEIMPRFDAEALLRIIERERITSIGLAPIMFVRLLRLPAEVRNAYDLSSLRWAIHAGGPCAADVKRAMIDWWGPIIAEYYGGTETGPLTLCTSEEWSAHPGSVGRPIEGARIRIVDAAGHDVPRGQPGEIYGRLDPYPDFTYHNDPDKRRIVGLDDLVSLGDIGYQDQEGYLYLCGRARDMIVSGGVNIYPAEVEEALSRLPGIDDCAVFGIPDTEFGESVVAYVVGADVQEETLRDALRLQIASYKIPRRIIALPSLDRDASGKLRKRQLRDRYLMDLA